MYFHIVVATERQIPCPVGTYNPNKNGDTVNSCLPCTAGYYCEEQTVNPTKKCLPGYYCPTNITYGVSALLIGSYGQKQVPCPAQTYSNVSGTKDVSECKPCPIGFYCLEGTDNPKICPRGSYCQDNSAVPTPCPIGTYGASEQLHYRENCTLCTRGWLVSKFLLINTITHQ